MRTEKDTQNICIATNDIKSLQDFKRGILPKEDEYKLKGLALEVGRRV